MREFVIYYTLENDIKREKIIKEKNGSREDVVQEIFEKVKRNNYFLVKGDHGDFWVNASLIRYIRVLDETPV